MGRRVFGLAHGVMLEKRSTEREITELRDVDAAVAREAYRGMTVFNRLGGGIGVVRRFVWSEARRLGSGRPLRVLDIGSGSCDIPLAVSRWARKHRIAVEFTAVERSETAVELCRRRITEARDSAVRVVPADIFHYQPEQPFDCAVGSMFFHHFTNEEIRALAARLRTFVTGSLLISDLLRYTPFYVIAWAGARFLSPELRHDVLVSIRRGFKLTELRHLFRDMPGVAVTVARHRFFRAVAVVRFRNGS
jgi:SAM-dependent methyltransferase